MIYAPVCEVVWWLLQGSWCTLFRIVVGLVFPAVCLRHSFQHGYDEWMGGCASHRQCNVRIVL
jgi:hypothetical protein